MTHYLPSLLACSSLLFALLALSWLYRARERNKSLTAELNQCSDKLKKHQVELEHATRVKKDFLSNMSHEIRNPLNGILGIARLLRTEHPSGDQPPELVEHLYSCANHLHHLLSQTLDYSSLASKELELRPEAFSPIQVINEVVRIHQTLIDEKGLDLQLELPDEALMWIGDHVLLRQILINLVSNAVKYTPKGSVRIHLSYDTSGTDIIARFEIADTGPGIPKDQQAYIFESFTRLASPADSSTSGVGLGLKVATEIATLMQGSVTLDTKVPQGACFVLSLPFSVSNEHPPTAENAEHQPLNGRHVLIADDMDFNRYINKILLQKQGATVHEVTDGIAAQLALETMYFDFAIMDINMPGLSGIEVAQKVLSNGSLFKPEFIALSGHATPEMKSDCLAAGFGRFIEKPLDQDKLKSLIEKPIASPSPARSALDNSLLNYLADNDPDAVTALENRYNTSLIQEIENLKESICQNDKEAQQQAIHKLKGLTSIKKDTTLLDLLKLMKQYVDVNAPEQRRLSLCEQIKQHIKENS